jgi:hypothetical protein
LGEKYLELNEKHEIARQQVLEAEREKGFENPRAK